MKKLAWITLIAGYLALTASNDSEMILIIAMILFAISFTAGLQAYHTDLRDRN